MVVLSTKWTKISFAEYVHFYNVGSSEGSMFFCWGVLSFCEPTFWGLRLWLKLRHTWFVSALLCTIPLLFKIVCCCFLFLFLFCCCLSLDSVVMLRIDSRLCSTMFVLCFILLLSFSACLFLFWVGYCIFLFLPDIYFNVLFVCFIIWFVCIVILIFVRHYSLSFYLIVDFSHNLSDPGSSLLVLLFREADMLSFFIWLYTSLLFSIVVFVILLRFVVAVGIVLQLLFGGSVLDWMSLFLLLLFCSREFVFSIPVLILFHIFCLSFYSFVSQYVNRAL